MPLKKEKDNQKISAKNAGDVNATNLNIGTVKNLTIISSELIKAKKFQEEDKEKWEKEETIFSSEDIEMINQIIKSEEEVKETLPFLALYKEVFDVLPKDQKGLFLTALRNIIREDRLSKKLFGKDNVIIENLDRETMNILQIMEEEENYNKIFASDFYEDYKKIYNIIRSRDLERQVIPFIEKIKKTTPEQDLNRKFERYWNRRLDNHPYAVFINFIRDKWRFDILGKFDNNEKEDVRVYARSSIRVSFAKTICKEIAKDRKCKIKINNYPIGSSEAVEIIFTVNKK